MQDQASKEEKVLPAHAIDPLLEALVFITNHYGRTKSAEAIKAGQAYDEKGMSPELFCEAADAQGFKTDIVKKPSLERFSKALMPCIIFLKNDQVCVLQAFSRAGKKARVFVPETGGYKDIELRELQKEYTGYSILIHPKPTFNKAKNQDPYRDENHWFWGLVRQSRSTYMMVILGSLFINLFALVSPLFIMNVYDRVIPNNAIETGWALGIGALAAYIFDFIFRTVRGYLIDFAGRKTDVQAARRIYDHLLDMKLADRPKSSGEFANMLKDFESVREFFTSATITAIVDLPFTLLFLFFIYQLGGAIAFVLMAVLIAAFTVGLVIQYALKGVVRKSIHAAQGRHGLLVETIHGLETIKASHAEGKFRARYGETIGEDAEFAKRSRFLSGLGVNLTAFLQQSASILIVIVGMYLVKDGDITAGGLIACVILGGRAISPLAQIANLMTRYHQAGSAMKTLNGIMSTESERPANKDFLHRPNLKGHIKFDDVSFTYPHVEVPVLKGISFSIKPGEKVGIIGRVGSGKSTISKLMIKLYEPEKGVVLVDETDYRQIDPADLRKSFAYIGQEAVLFNGSVKDNIIVTAPQATEEEVLECAKAAGVHDFISHHPMGYDAPVGEQGSSLSGGQRQAIAFARAMITKPNVLICDEPTSAMDTQTEQQFFKYIQEKSENKTLILITHKHNLLNLVDRLILMHEGEIIMDGPRDDVVKALNSGKVKVQGKQ